MNKKALILFCTCFCIAYPTTAEDSAEKVCKSASELYADGDLEGALEEARWCVTLMEQEQQSQTNQYFLDDINGFQGGKLEQQNAMGFMVVSRQYEKGGSYIDVSMNAGSSGGAMQAFSALAQFGMQSGADKKMRIQKRTAMATDEGGNANVTITLRSGGMLTFESSDVDLDTLVTFAKAFPVADLDDSRG